MSEGKELKDIYHLADDYMETSYKDAKEKLARHEFNDERDFFKSLSI